jgi:hypothetical protein
MTPTNVDKPQPIGLRCLTPVHIDNKKASSTMQVDEAGLKDAPGGP